MSHEKLLYGLCCNQTVLPFPRAIIAKLELLPYSVESLCDHVLTTSLPSFIKYIQQTLSWFSHLMSKKNAYVPGIWAVNTPVFLLYPPPKLLTTLSNFTVWPLPKPRILSLFCAVNAALVSENWNYAWIEKTQFHRLIRFCMSKFLDTFFCLDQYIIWL